MITESARKLFVLTFVWYIWLHYSRFYSAPTYASAVLAIVELSVRPSVRHVLVLWLNDQIWFSTVKKVKERIAVNGFLSHSYGTSLAIWDHAVLPATRHKWTRLQYIHHVMLSRYAAALTSFSRCDTSRTADTFFLAPNVYYIYTV